jgi:PPOX class probable F420-dependent enzyme
VELVDAIAYARNHRWSVLTTLKRDGRPQLSNVSHAIDDEGTVRVSVTATRAKYLNMRRDPRISLHVTAPDFGTYVVLEGEADLSPVSASAHDATVDELVEYYRALVGEHSDWDDYRRAMVADQRAMVRLRPTYAYGHIG